MTDEKPMRSLSGRYRHRSRWKRRLALGAALATAGGVAFRAGWVGLFACGLCLGLLISPLLPRRWALRAGWGFPILATAVLYGPRLFPHVIDYDLGDNGLLVVCNLVGLGAGLLVAAREEERRRLRPPGPLTRRGPGPS